MGFLRKSLKARTVTYFLSLSVLIVVSLAGIAYMLTTGYLEQMAFEQLEVIANYKEYELNRFMGDQREAIVRIAEVPAIREAVEALLVNTEQPSTYQMAYDTLGQLVESTAATVPDLTEILFLTDEGGRIFFSTDKTHEGEYRVTDYYFTEGRVGPVIQNVYPSPVTFAPTLTVASPLLSNEGQRLGVVAAHVNLTKLDSVIKERTGLGDSGEAYLVDAYNMLITAEGFGTEDYPRGVHSEGIDAAVRGESGAGLYSNHANESVIGIYRWIPERELALLTEIRAYEAFAPARQLGLTIVVVGLVAVGLLAIGIYLITRQITRPILAVTDTAVKIAAGDLTQKAPVTTQDETGILAKTFNKMTSRLRNTLEDLAAEQEKSERLLLNILPEQIADRLKKGEITIADSFEEVSVLFADIVGFSAFAARVSPTEVVNLLNQMFSLLDRLGEQRGLEKIKTIGDAYMVAGGLPTPRAGHAEAVAEMALDIQEEIARFNAEHSMSLSMRVGINTGPVIAGVIGTKKFIYDLWGDTVNTASRMESHGVGGCIQVTAATYERLKDKYLFEDRGLINVKGKGKMHTYFLKGRKTPSP